MLSILKGKSRLLQEIKELRAKNDALLRKNCVLRDRLSQLMIQRRDDDRTRGSDTR